MTGTPSMQEEVARWMRAFGQVVQDRPAMPNKDVLSLRINLIEEETIETVNALSTPIPFKELQSLGEIADGLADLLVVTFGTAAALGIDIGPVFAEVMRSNWSKFWTGDEVIPLSPDLFQVTRANINGSRCFIVMRKSDMKVIKSPSYQSAMLRPIIEAQMKVN